MVPPNLNFWYISRKESLESQPKQALRSKFLRTLLCSNDNFNPGYNRTEFVLTMNSCFLQYNAPLVDYVNVPQEIDSFRQK